MNSKNGMTNMDKNMTAPLKAREIAVIIRACCENRVKSLTYGGLQLEFHNKIISSERNLEPQEVPQVTSQSQESEIKSELTPVDLAAIEELARAQLLIDDPEAYENLMVSEDLERGRIDESTEYR